MDRLWTFQESFLARKLIFVMDGPRLVEFDVSEGAGGLPRPSLPLGTIWLSLAKYLEKLKPLGPRKPPGTGGRLGSRLGMVYSGLRWRRTSKSDDETIAIAGVLGLDKNVGDLLSLIGEERKVMFWRLLKWVPRNVIHLPGPKLSSLVEGFRWVPLSLMYCSEGGNSIHSGEVEAEVTEGGLVGEWDGIVLGNGMTLVYKAGEDIYISAAAAEVGSLMDGEVYHLTGLGDRGDEFRFNAVLGSGKGWGDITGTATIATAVVFVDGNGSCDADAGEMVTRAQCTQRMAVRKIGKEILRGNEKVELATIQNLRLCIV
jgi:hypothetical protein